MSSYNYSNRLPPILSMASESEREPLLTSVNATTHYYDRSISSNPANSLKLTFQKPNNVMRLLPGVLVLVLVVLERIAFYSLTGNLYLYLHESDFHWMFYNALSALLIFTGISYLSSLFGGWLSDAYLGRAKTLGVFFIVFSVAYWFLPYVTRICPSESEPMINLTNSSNPASFDVPLYDEYCSQIVMCVLIIAAIGTGVVKANITPFGAEQVRYSGPDGLRLFLNWLYWCVNIGALIAILGITYIQQEDGFITGYIVPASLLTGATLLFWLTYPLYTREPPAGSSISRTFGVVKEAWKSNHVVTNEGNGTATVNRPFWLDKAKVRYGGKFHESVVEDVKSLSTIIKVFVAFIPYWMLYFQMQSTFLAQGLQMRLSLTSSNQTNIDDSQKFTIPAAWLMLFNVVFLVIFIPLLNHIIYPCLSRRGIQISMLTRMAIGMVCAALSMIIAGCLELCRLHFIWENKVINQTIENTTFVAADLSILWQIPQYSLIGISEVFTSVSGMEFACSQAPYTMQGAVMGLYYFFAGIGSFLGVAALKLFEQISKTYISHPSTDINTGDLYYYFFFLAVLQLVALAIFTLISKNLKIRKPPSPHGSTSSLMSSSTRPLRRH